MPKKMLSGERRKSAGYQSTSEQLLWVSGKTDRVREPIRVAVWDVDAVQAAAESSRTVELRLSGKPRGRDRCF